MVTLLALPMNTGINFRDMVALRTAFYTQKIITKRKLLKIKLGGGEGRGERGSNNWFSYITISENTEVKENVVYIMFYL